MTLIELLFTLLQLIGAVIVASAALSYVVLKLCCSTYAPIIVYESEKTFKDPRAGNQCRPFPSLESSSPSIGLSVIVPAYNEVKRLPKMLDEALAYLTNRAENGDPSHTFEIIVVDDGSRDSTTRQALAYSREYGSDTIRVLTLERNRGKGGAVRAGVMRARGKRILFADADGATRFSDVAKLEAELLPSGRADIVVGSRAHLEEDSIARRSIPRTILMYGFHFAVFLFGVRGIRDTQCGFKLFTRSAAQRVYPSMHIERWAFDVELLRISRQLNLCISEVGVNWTEIPGSKVTPVLTWIQMGVDLVFIWFRYVTGIWLLKPSALNLSPMTASSSDGGKKRS